MKTITEDRKKKGGKRCRAALAAACAMALVGCAGFSTTQRDVSFNPDGSKLREITTHASARTFWESDSALAQFKATQTDKTQSAAVGTLNQSSDVINTNVMAGAGVILGQALKTMAKP